jgi:hypothetical protein
VLNATPEQKEQAAALVEATRAVTGAALTDGVISLTTVPYGLDGTCGVAPPRHVSGCSYGNQIEVLVMPPLLGPDLGNTALPHELCHQVVGLDEALANSCAQSVILAYQGIRP